MSNINRQNTVIATAKTATNYNSFDEVFTVLNNPDILTMFGIVVGLLFVSLFLGNRKNNKITSGRFANNGDKLQATKKALKQIESVKQNQPQPCTLWSGTPNYWFEGKLKKIGASWQTMLGASPTVWFPHAERGILVIGAPGSGKTFSVIDRLLESAYQQGLPVAIYDKKGDQMELHAALATRYGYSVRVFAPGEPYSGVINPLECMDSPQDATMAGEIGQIIIQNSPGVKNSKGDSFFQQNGAMLAKGLLQLAKSSEYPDLAMVYALARLPQFIQRLEYAVYREDEYRLDPWIAATFATFLSSKDAEKTVAGIKATAETTYSAFIQKDLLRAFIGKSTIPLKQKRKQLTIFKLDDKRRSILAPLLATNIHLCLVENLAQKRDCPYVYSLDEFPSIYLDRTVNYVNEYRSNGGVPIIGIQSLNQLYETYGNQKGKAIASALSTHVLFNPGDVETAEIYSKRYGETEIMLKNRSTGRSIGKHGSRSVNWSEQIHKKPLITSDEILRFPEGKCVITSPAYGNGREALFPYKLKIPVSKKDKQRAKQSEQLWNESIKAQLIARCERIQAKTCQSNTGEGRMQEAVLKDSQGIPLRITASHKGRSNTEKDIQSLSKQKQSIEDGVFKPNESKKSKTSPTNQPSGGADTWGLPKCLNAPSICPKTSALPPKADKDSVVRNRTSRG
ncbi:MAG: type IV secretion system DNA-binding domain-containing protein [Xenococcaceae cyanobacterium MO_188.B32]|nr:type IV secretion system DNA-binding domain-containing protein [Xenococcaceae cyanobacterium MO_188.B32]